MKPSELRAWIEAFATSRESGNAGDFEIVACLRKLEQWLKRPVVDTSLANRVGRAVGIGDQEDDDNVLWRALHVLGIDCGPHLRIVSRPKDTGPVVALKAEMWRGLGPVHPYDLDAYVDDPGPQIASRERWLSEVLTYFSDSAHVTLIVTSPLGDHGLLPAIAERVQAAGKELVILFYSGRYNLQRAARDIAAVLGCARVFDVSRHPFLGGSGCVLDNMWSVHGACPEFAAFCEFSNPRLSARVRDFRTRFNRERLVPSSVFERRGPNRVPRAVLSAARELWACQPPDNLDAYRAFLQRDDVKPHIKSWKHSTIEGYERDAPIADTCLALVVLLLRVAPEELSLVVGHWRVQGDYSVVEPQASEHTQGPATAIKLAAPRREIYALFIGLLAAARATFPDA